MRTTAGGLIVVIVVLALITLCVRFVEPHLAFFPTAGEQRTPKAFGIDFTPHTVVTADGERIQVWHLPRDAPQARIIYFHGNGGNLSLWADVLAGLWQQGFDVVALDYRGYGLRYLVGRRNGGCIVTWMRRSNSLTTGCRAWMCRSSIGDGRWGRRWRRTPRAGEHRTGSCWSPGSRRCGQSSRRTL